MLLLIYVIGAVKAYINSNHNGSHIYELGALSSVLMSLIWPVLAAYEIHKHLQDVGFYTKVKSFVERG